MIVTILGWILIVSGAIVIILCLYLYLKHIFYNWISRIEDNGVQKFLDRNEGNSYWISNGNRKPFGEFHSYLFTQFRKGGASGDFVRSKVDDIIEQYEIKTSED